MSGSVEELSRDAVDILDDNSEKKALLRDIIHHLLACQYVGNDVLRNRLWKVQQGSGMGLIQSSSVADSAFYTKVEYNLKANMHKLGIRKYEDRVSFKKHYSSFKKKGEYFALHVEEYNPMAVGMLQVEASVKNSRLNFKPKLKQTSLGTPLSHASRHPPAVHIWWPHTMIRQLPRIPFCGHDKWLTLGFHPALYRTGLSGALYRMSTSPEYVEL